jgi:hypothetical protein
MPEYMLLFYAEPATPEMQAERNKSLPLWLELHENLVSEGVFVESGRLQPTDVATTVRVRGDETEITDGPFAVTKEVLGGYFILDCADLDEAIRHAARVPLAKFGSVEVRPLMENPLQGAREAAAAAAQA